LIWFGQTQTKIREERATVIFIHCNRQPSAKQEKSTKESHGRYSLKMAAVVLGSWCFGEYYTVVVSPSSYNDFPFGVRLNSSKSSMVSLYGS